MADDSLWMVINHEEQYSIWPADKDIPGGWEKIGVEGDRKRCMEYFLEKVWTDMTPRVINPFRG